MTEPTRWDLVQDWLSRHLGLAVILAGVAVVLFASTFGGRK